MATWSFDGSLPVASSSSEFTGGWGLVATLPVMTLEAAYKTGWKLDAEVRLVPRLSSSSRQKWRMAGELPVAVMSAVFSHGNTWSLDATLPVVEMEGYFYLIDADSQTAFCLNPMNRAHAEYTNFAFNSFCEFNGAFLGLDSIGIYTLTGEDDAGTPIDSSLRFGPVDEDSSKQKRVDSVYLNLRHDGEINVLMKYDEMEEDVSVIDHDPTIDPVGIYTRRAKFSRGARGRNLQVGIENVSGADFEIVDLLVVTVPLSRS